MGSLDVLALGITNRRAPSWIFRGFSADRGKDQSKRGARLVRRYGISAPGALDFGAHAATSCRALHGGWRKSRRGEWIDEEGARAVSRGGLGMVISIAFTT